MKKLISEFLGFIFLGCSLVSCVDIPDDYSLPSWDSQISIPICDRSYTAEEMTKNSKYLSIDSSNTNYFLYAKSDTISKRYGLEAFSDGRLNISLSDIKAALIAPNMPIEIPFGNGVEVDSAEFANGSVYVELSNNSKTPISGSIVLPNFIKGGSPLKFDINVKGGETYKLNQDISNAIYTAYQNANKGVFKLNIISSTYAGEQITISFKISYTKFNYLAGIIPAKQLDDLNADMAMDLGENLNELRNKINLHRAELSVEAKYLSNISNLFDIALNTTKIIGKTRNGQTRNFHKNDAENLGDYLISSGYLFQKFSNDNSNISEFISLFPDTVNLKSAVIMNPYNKRGAVRLTDSFDIKASFVAWGLISADQVEYKDTVTLDIKNKDRDKIADAKSAKITIDAMNNIPAGATLTAYFCDDSYTPFFNKEILINSASANADGFSNATGVTLAKLVFNAEETKFFSKTTKIVIKVKLSTFNSGKAAIRSVDNIKFKIYASVNYNINLDK
jgi:hypothetical protein